MSLEYGTKVVQTQRELTQRGAKQEASAAVGKSH